MEYEKCYIFEPEDSRPTKRRRIEPQGLHRSWPQREELYKKAWQEVKQSIDSYTSTVNEKVLNNLFRFLDAASPASPGSKDIPTAFISTGAEGGSIKRIADNVSQHINKTVHGKLVSLSAGDGTNLKALLKSLIRKATSRDEGADEDDGGAGSSKISVNAKLLNHDLQILANHVKTHKVRQISIMFYDSETFDSELLSELIELLGHYQDRIPVAFTFCLATSVDFLRQRLTRKAARYLSGELFDLAPTSKEVEKVFDGITQYDTPVWIGPTLMSLLFERQHDYIQSIDTLIDEIQYAYMSAYYANALTLFLDRDIQIDDISEDHFAAARNLPSFRHWYMHDLDPEHGDVLEDDAALLQVLKDAAEDSHDQIYEITRAIDLIQQLQQLLSGTQETVPVKLYIQAMSNKLNNSSLIRTLLLSIRKAPSNVTEEIVKAVANFQSDSPFLDYLQRMSTEFRKLFETQGAAQKPLRSEDDVQNSTLRTTVVAQKVELSKQKSTLSKEDTAYTTLLRKFTDHLEAYFNATFIDPKSLLLHEVFIYDLKSPLREVFTPRPRHAIERALAAPHDYLDCDCCAPGKDDGDEQTLSASQPATAVLYQLYLESGSLINASDLWQAFQAVMGEGNGEEQNMALFQRALAELKYLGMVKNTRKRVDHVAKVAWRGL